MSPSRSHTDAQAIQRERERRHWTIEQWKEDAPDEHWPTHMANVRHDADAAVDALLADLQRKEEALRRLRPILQNAKDGFDNPPGYNDESLNAYKREGLSSGCRVGLDVIDAALAAVRKEP